MFLELVERNTEYVEGVGWRWTIPVGYEDESFLCSKDFNPWSLTPPATKKQRDNPEESAAKG